MTASPKPKPVHKREEQRMKKELVFTAKNGEDTSKLSGPKEGSKASEVLFDVLSRGPVPDGLKLRFAKSYGAHYLDLKGRNALGFNDQQSNLLVVNGIATELKKAGVKGIIQPQKGKKYFAISLTDLSANEIKSIANHAARILGFTGKPKTSGAKVKKAEGKKATTTATPPSEATVAEATPATA